MASVYQTRASTGVKQPNKMYEECITGNELDIACDNDAILHQQCDGKINNITFKTKNIELWKTVLQDFFENTCVSNPNKSNCVIKVMYEENNSVKFNFFTTGKVNIQGATCSSFYDKYFQQLEHIVMSKKSDSSDNTQPKTLHNDLDTHIDETSSTDNNTDNPENNIVNSEKDTHEREEMNLHDTNTDKNNNEPRHASMAQPEQGKPELELMESTLVQATDKIYKQLTNMISTKFHEIEQQLNTTCDKQERFLKTKTDELKQSIVLHEKNEKQKTTDQQKMEKEMKRLEETVNKLQKTNADLTNQVSNLQFQNALLEDKYKGEKQSHENTRSNFKISNESHLKEDQYLTLKLESKNKQIEELEASLNHLRKMLDQKEDDIYKMKLHIGSVADTQAGTFIEKGGVSPNKGNQAGSPIDKEGTSPKRGNQVNEQTPKRKTDKTSLVLIGTSNTKHIELQRWSKYSTKKITAYTIDDAINYIGTMKEEPDVMIFHSLTNDIKHMTPNECTAKMLDLIEKTKNKIPDTKIIISLATPRSDREEWNIKQEIVNAMLKQTLRGKEKVYISENSNLAYYGHPKRGLIEKDGVHLTRDGAAILASNLKRSVDKLFDMNSGNRRYHQRDYLYYPWRGYY